MKTVLGRGSFRGLLVAAIATATLAAGLARASDPARVEIHIRYSHFEPPAMEVPVGRAVTFVLVNDDPIDHEWILGDEAVQERHRRGTEAHHDSLQTEISIPALSTRETIITFERPVTWSYICHLPGHEAYGMVGILTAR